MNRALEDMAATLIKGKSQSEFQYLIDRLYLAKYGSDGFLPIRDKKDKGNDGIILTEQRAIAVYGAEVEDMKRFKKKVDGDFASYQKYQQFHYPNWSFIYNHEILNSRLEYIRSKKIDAVPIGCLQIVNDISNLGLDSQTEILLLLGIDKQMIITNSIQNIIFHLAKKKDTIPSPVHIRPIDLDSKIEINFEEYKDTRRVIIEDLLVEYFGYIEAIFKINPNEKIATIQKIVLQFERSSGNFTDKIDNVIEILSAEFEKHDIYRTYVSAIVYYCFEQCKIGKTV